MNIIQKILLSVQDNLYLDKYYPALKQNLSASTWLKGWGLNATYIDKNNIMDYFVPLGSIVNE